MDTPCDLFDAVVDCNYNVVNRLINEGIDVNYTSKSGEMALHMAIEKGQTDIAFLLINSGCDINIKSGNDKTPLFLAAEFNNVTLVKALLCKPNLNVNLFCYGETPLHIACTEGHADIVKEFVCNFRTMFWMDIRFQGNLPIHIAVNNSFNHVIEILLDKITSVNSTDRDGHTPLWIALKRKKEDVIQLLLNNYRVNVNMRYDGITPLVFAIKEHMEDTVRLLVAKGSNVLAKDSDKRTVLHHCALESTTNLVQVFIDKGVDLSALDIKGYTAFHYAVTRWDIAVITLFIKNGVDIDSRIMSEYGYTPLQLAFKRGNFEVAKLLIQNGANINSVDPCCHFAMSRGGTLLHWSCRSDRKSEIKFLIENGANVNAEEHDGRTPLCLLVKHGGSIDSMKYLIDNGAKLNTDKGGAPLYWAFYMRYYNIANFLIENGSDVNGCGGTFDSWDLRRTPLHLVKDLTTVKLLIERGANVNAIDKEGNTPLHHIDMLPIAKYLVDNGANINSCNFKGDTPLHSASNVHIAEFLIEKGANVNFKNHKGATPLHTAKNIQIAQILAEYGADVTAVTNDGGTVLHSISDNDFESLQLADLIHYFVGQGIDINQLDNQGNSALKLSFLRWNHQVMRALLNNGAPVHLFSTDSNSCYPYEMHYVNDLLEALKTNKPIGKWITRIRTIIPLNYQEEDTKSTIFHIAVKNGRRDFVDLLNIHFTSFLTFSNRIHINARDIDGQTPLHIAALKNDISIVKTLLSSGAIYNCKNLNGKIPLHLTESTEVKEILSLVDTAFDAAKQNDIAKLTECLNKEKCILNSLNETSSSLLHIACTNLNSDMVSLLLKKGGDVSLINDKKSTILHSAVSFKNKNILLSICTHFIKLYKLHNCRYNNKWSRINPKLSIFYDYINLKNIDGRTALHIASELGASDNIKLLLRCGAMFNVCDAYGQTPLCCSPDEHIAKYFMSVEELFNFAKTGEREIVKKLKNSEINEIFSSATRNKFGDTLCGFLKVNGHDKLAEEIKNYLQDPFELFNAPPNPCRSLEVSDDTDDSDEDMGFGLFD